MASFVSGSCRYLAWEDAKRSANETNNNAIILEDHHVPCSLRVTSVTSSHKTGILCSEVTRSVLYGIGFLLLNLEHQRSKKARHKSLLNLVKRKKKQIKHDLNFANIA